MAQRALLMAPQIRAAALNTDHNLSCSVTPSFDCPPWSRICRYHNISRASTKSSELPRRDGEALNHGPAARSGRYCRETNEKLRVKLNSRLNSRPMETAIDKTVRALEPNFNSCSGAARSSHVTFIRRCVRPFSLELSMLTFPFRWARLERPSWPDDRDWIFSGDFR